MKTYKPSNFYLFFNNKIRNVLELLIPIPLIIINFKLNENNWIGKIVFFLTLASLFFVIKPLYFAFIKRKEKYEVNENSLVYHHGTLIGQNISSYAYGKMNVELKTNFISHYLIIDDFTPEDNEVKLYLRSKHEAIELFQLLQNKNSQRG